MYDEAVRMGRESESALEKIRSRSTLTHETTMDPLFFQTYQ